MPERTEMRNNPYNVTTIAAQPRNTARDPVDFHVWSHAAFCAWSMFGVAMLAICLSGPAVWEGRFTPYSLENSAYIMFLQSAACSTATGIVASVVGSVFHQRWLSIVTFSVISAATIGWLIATRLPIVIGLLVVDLSNLYACFLGVASVVAAPLLLLKPNRRYAILFTFPYVVMLCIGIATLRW